MATQSNAQSQTQAGPSSGPRLSQHQQRLHKAAATFKNLTSQDAQHVDLADYLNASANQPYKLFLSHPWAPLRKVRTLTIPDAVIQASTSAQSVASQGLFPEIERAWIVIDSQLYLWNYLEASSSAFESYVHPTDVIRSVSLVAPKAGVFIDSIKHLLLVSTQSSLTILGLAFETSSAPNSSQELKLYQTDFAIQTSGTILSDAVATKDGSRVFCRGSDACLYELSYQAKEGWFSSKCSLKNLTSSGVKNLLPQWAGGANKETMDSLVIDDSRSIMYASLNKRSISVYSIPSQASSPPQLITTLRDIHRTASLISPNNATLLRQEDFAIISLQPIHSDESRTVCLVAVTSNGVRLYFTNQRSGYRAFTTPSSTLSGVSTLELLYVRLPPAGGLTPTPTPPSVSGMDAQADHPPVQPPLQHLSHALYRGGILLAAGPYAYESGLDNILSVQRSTATSSMLSNTSVSAGAPDAVPTALVPMSAAPTPAVATDTAEQATNVLVHGATWAVAEVPRAQSASLNPMVRQMTSLPRTFLVLTSSGLTVLVERRPLDLLRDLLERYSTAAGPGNAEAVGLVDVFKRHGQAQSCAMALAIATRNSHLGVSIEGLLSVKPATPGTFTAQMFSAESITHAVRTYFDYGGSPRYELPPYPHQPITEGRVVLSGRHDGLAVYVARLVSQLWERNLRDIGKTSGPTSASLQTGKDLEELRTFVRSHAETFGINAGRAGHAAESVASSEGELLALRIEQESLRAIFALLERVIEALSFATLIGDFGWDRVLSKLPDTIRAKASAMKFSDLVLEPASLENGVGQSGAPNAAGPASDNVSRSLVEALIDLHSLSSASGMDVIADLLQAQCPSFCDANDVRIYKALECVRQAKEAVGGPRREEALRESELLMTKAGGRLPMERLEEIIRLWREMDWVGGAVRLPLTCAMQWDHHGVARAYRQDGLPAGDDARKAVYDRAMRCYALVLATLKHLDEDVESKRLDGKSDSASSGLQKAESLRTTAYSIVQQSPDPLLHEALYDFLLHSGRREQLLELRTPFLEAYLQQEPLTLEKLEMLWQCYTRRGEGASAARVLVGLAESTELQLNLYQRVEYLTLAANNARSSSSVGPNGPTSSYATVSFVAEIEEKLEVAQVQVEVYRCINELTSLDDDRKDVLLEDLDSALLDISTLYRDFADPLNLYDIKILIFQVSDFRDGDLVVSTWESILDRAHDEGTRTLGSDRAYERVAAVVIELGRRFMASEFACPVDVLVRNLESYALTQRSTQKTMSKFWAVQTLLSATAPPEAIFDTLEALFQSKAEPWQTRSALAVLLADIHHLLSAWMTAYLAVSSPYDDAFGSTGRDKRASKAFSSSAALFDLSVGGGSGAGVTASEVEATSALVAALARTSHSASSSCLTFPTRRVDDALDAYLVNLNSLASSSNGLRDESEARQARETLNGMKALQDRLRGIF
ncbi:unnamed protein product [Parajaminaea phylloscopi]